MLLYQYNELYNLFSDIIDNVPNLFLHKIDVYSIPSKKILVKVFKIAILFTVEQEKFALGNGLQPPVTLTSPKRELIAATFHINVIKKHWLVLVIAHLC